MYIDLNDFPYTSIPADIFSLLEPALMVICACLPIMRPLFKRFLPSLSSIRGSSKKGMSGDTKGTGANDKAKFKRMSKQDEFSRSGDEVMLTQMSVKTAEIDEESYRQVEEIEYEDVVEVQVDHTKSKNEWSRPASGREQMQTPDNRIGVTTEWVIERH